MAAFKTPYALHNATMEERFKVADKEGSLFLNEPILVQRSHLVDGVWQLFCPIKGIAIADIKDKGGGNYTLIPRPEYTFHNLKTTSMSSNILQTDDMYLILP